jgi:hypothetical protein
MIITHHSVGSRAVVPSRSPRAPVMFRCERRDASAAFAEGHRGLGSNYHASKNLPVGAARPHSDLPAGQVALAWE